MINLTSEERHEARYQRRKAARLAKAAPICGKPFEDVMNFPNMVRAGKACCNGSRWKTSTINFETNLLGECRTVLDRIEDGTWKFSGFRSFTTVEHGKARQIDALRIQDRAPQKCMCRNILTEAMSRSFIRNNCACLKNRGMDFMLKALKEDLRRHYRKYGTAGGILQVDFSGYFRSIPHDGMKQRLCRAVWDEHLQTLLCQWVGDFRKMGNAPGDARGAGLGSEISQIIALDYTSPIDHMIKDGLGIKGYGRYMDDLYVISSSLDELKQILREIRKMAVRLGLTLSEKKCRITPFRHHGFRFLKMRIRLTDTGKVVIKLNRKAIKQMRQKLTVFRKWVNDGRFSFEDAAQSYQSWRAYAKRCNSYNTLHGMDILFCRMFAEELRTRKRQFPCTLHAHRTSKGWRYHDLHSAQKI